MYCRRQAAAGAFGHFVYAEGEYLHDVDSPGTNLREVRRLRLASAAGREWAQRMPETGGRDLGGGPMHYPTHSTSGPISVMGAHAVKVSAWGFRPPEPDDYFGEEFSNETALFHMSNGATMRICEYRQVGHPGSEVFRVFGTEGTFRENVWLDRSTRAPLTIDEMREPLPPEVEDAFRAVSKTSDFYGGHGGSHAYLVHEFVDAIAHERTPAINSLGGGALYGSGCGRAQVGLARWGGVGGPRLGGCACVVARAPRRSTHDVRVAPGRSTEGRELGGFEEVRSPVSHKGRIAKGKPRCDLRLQRGFSGAEGGT